MSFRNRVMSLSFFVFLPIFFTAFASAAAPRVKLLYSFAGGADGQYPDTTLARDQFGDLYGVTTQGGVFGHGTVFELTFNGIHRVLYNFSGASDGSEPSKGVYVDWDGKTIYGATLNGGGGSCPEGCGTFYKLTKTGDEEFSFATIYSFTGASDGAHPASPLLLAVLPIWNFYGMTTEGGAYGFGVIYDFQQDTHNKWHYHVIYNFRGTTDGVGNSSPLAMGKKFLMGTSPVGGVNGKGAIFELSYPGQTTGEWIFSTMHSFTDSPDGALPLGGLALRGEDFYGVTSSGGAYGFGTVFQWRVFDAYRVLYNFKGASDGANPIATPVTTYDFAHIYGTTTTGGDEACSCGTLFRIFLNAQGGANENIVLRMTGAPTIGLSYDQMFKTSDTSDGPYYGATVTGGTSNNGAIYELLP